MADKMKRCLIIGSAPMGTGAVLDGLDLADMYIICADGGLDTALKKNMKPHLVVGDFDSAAAKPPHAVETIYLPAAKDDTDMMFAIKEGFRRGCTHFLILGGLGARLDHSYANFCALRYIAEHGGTGILEDDDTCVYFLAPCQPVLELREKRGKTISVFPFGVPSCTLTYEGLRYPLEQGVLTSQCPVGISNIVEQQQARIILHEGSAILMLMKHVVNEAEGFCK